MSNRIVPRWVRTTMCLITALTIPLTLSVMLLGISVDEKVLLGELGLSLGMARLAFGK